MFKEILHACAINTQSHDQAHLKIKPSQHAYITDKCVTGVTDGSSS